MKFILMLLTVLSLEAFAHEEDHGPKLQDAPKRGGRLTSVILAKEEAKGKDAALVYKGELVRKKSESKVLLYLFDKNMVLLKLQSFSKTARGTLISKKNRQEVTQDFTLELTTDHFEGKLPKPTSKRYHIDVRLSEGERSLFAAFDNLD